MNRVIILVLACMLNGIANAQEIKYAPGKVTKGTQASYKAFQLERIPFMLYVTNGNCRDRAVLTMYYKDGTKVRGDEEVYADMDFSISEVRAAIHEVFSESELRRYSASAPRTHIIHNI